MNLDGFIYIDEFSQMTQPRCALDVGEEKRHNLEEAQLCALDLGAGGGLV